jgi:hypothetical protein
MTETSANQTNVNVNVGHDQIAPLPMAANEWLLSRPAQSYTWVWMGSKFFKDYSPANAEKTLVAMTTPDAYQSLLPNSKVGRTIYSEYREFEGENRLCGVTFEFFAYGDGLNPGPMALLVSASVNANGDFAMSAYVPVQPFDKVRDLLQMFGKYLEPLTMERPKVEKGSVYAIIAGSNGLSFQLLPNRIPDNFVEDNYTPAVIKGYERVLGDLTAEKPTGRIAIFDGPPGSGKTHLLKAMLQTTGTTFVFVPPDLLPQLATPSFLPALIEFTRQQGQPITFLVEDADMCITAREVGSVSAVSAVLNLGDGILGQLMDIRLVMTTNAKVKDIDPAIRRPGRLSAMIGVEALPAEQAQRVYARLMGEAGKEATFTFEGDATLAEIYQKAFDAGWTEPVMPVKRKMGF